MKKVNLTFVLIGMLFISLVSCNEDDSDNPINVPVEFPERISFDSPSLYPEDFVYDESNERFFVGSSYGGEIVTVDLEGNVTPFTALPELVTVVGMAFDNVNNQLFVCNSDIGVSENGPSDITGTLATVYSFDGATGHVVNEYDLASLLPDQPHFINDMVFDNRGNLYITDSGSPVIYRISANGEMSVFATSPLFEVSPNALVGLNGIAFNPQGFLIVAHSENREFLKISISDPTDIEVVEMSESIEGGDGIRFVDDNTLLVVTGSIVGGESFVHVINSSDIWSSATVSNSISLGSGLNFPTTVEFADSTPYVIFSYIAQLFQNPQINNTSTFTLNRIDLNLEE